MEKVSKTKATISDCVALLRAKTPLLWVVTREDYRHEDGQDIRLGVEPGATAEAQRGIAL